MTQNLVHMDGLTYGQYQILGISNTLEKAIKGVQKKKMFMPVKLPSLILFQYQDVDLCFYFFNLYMYQRFITIVAMFYVDLLENFMFL